MIETKEQYEGIKERYPGAVPSDVIELIEALRKVARASNSLIEVTDRLASTDLPNGSVGYNFIEGQRNMAWSRWEDAATAVPDWIKEE